MIVTSETFTARARGIWQPHGYDLPLGRILFRWEDVPLGLECLPEVSLFLPRRSGSQVAHTRAALHQDVRLILVEEEYLLRGTI